MVSVKLALLEGTALFGGVIATILLWAHPRLVDWFDVTVVVVQAGALSLCCLIAFYYNDLYDLRIVRSLSAFASRLLQAFGVALILLSGFYAMFPAVNIADGPFLSSVLVIVGLLLPIRALGYATIHRRLFAERVLIVGSGPLAQKLMAEIDANPQTGYKIVAVAVDSPDRKGRRFPYPFVASVPYPATLLEDARIDRIIVAMTERRGRIPMTQLLEAQARGIPVEDGLQTYQALARKLAIDTLPPSSVVFSGGFAEARLNAALRRLISLTVATAGFLLTLPFMLLIGLAVKLDSPGPVLFLHDRIGVRGKPFKLAKFRTMVPADGVTSEWVHDNQHRITRVGRWLRTFRLDELPQFINILRGDMNLVGPRPHPVSNLALFNERIPYYVLRTAVRPGVTGWAQVRYGYANNLDEEIEKTRYDLYYIKHLSLWFDLRILVDTVKITLFGRGSYAADAYPLSPALERDWPQEPAASGHLDFRASESRPALNGHTPPPICLLSFDIEEWFQVENLRPIFPHASWDRVPSRVVAATRSILEILAEHDCRATFFVLGCVADKEPALVKDIADLGHEIASHGYWHVLPTQLSPAEFRDDALRARKTLEDITGLPVTGYRAPSFSLTHEHLAILAECGYRYDSSAHPFTLHDRYARLDNLGSPLRPGVYLTPFDIVELSLPVERIGPLQLPISGGGYFRLYPAPLFRRLVRRAILRDGHHLLYLHSWEFDPDMPRVKVPGFGSAFRHYNNLSRTVLRMRHFVALMDSLNATYLTMNDFVDAALAERPTEPAAPEHRRLVLSHP